MSYKFELMPIGGVGEIGHNMMVIKTKEEWILIDAGILFPSESFYNLQYLIPDFSTLDLQKTTSLVVTHAHEDHVGAIPHLWKLLPTLKIYASPLAKEIILLKTGYHLSNLPQAEKHLSPTIEELANNIITISGNSTLEFTTLNIYPIHVNHSIPETLGLLIQDKEQTASALYMSDCKYDDISPYEGVMDLKRASELSKNSKVRMLLLDSTNILRDQQTPSEANVIGPLQSAIEKQKGRIFVTFFPSNLHRLQTLIHIAKDLNKKILYYGRSLVQFSEAAQKVGLLQNYYETKLSDINEDAVNSIANAFPDEKMMIFLTGSQGDLKGALNRIVSGYDPLFKLRKDDVIIFSSRVIPGNEKRMAHIYNKIYKQGASIITACDTPIHVSGHLGIPDIHTVIKQYSPTHFIPIHGENYFLHKHEDLVQEHYPQIQTHLINNYDMLTVDNNLEVCQSEGIAMPPIFIQDNGLPIEKTALNQRKKLAYGGCVFITVTTLNHNQKITPRDFLIDFHALPEFLESIKHELIAFLQKNLQAQDRSVAEKMSEECKGLTRNFINSHLLYKPVVFVHILC
ncbi:MAG: ribonuclease J [Oligoflexia bacterium]|nr:ribonuclease J [Oligoflexia bacterium]MBF0364796.1 ribonuclease J [Oligoflexia bacterium]